MTPTLTASYAAVLALLYVAMTAYVITTRARRNINIGDGGDPHMLLAIRRHGNMTEYVPFALLLMGFAEILGLGATWLHLAGFALIGGRILHAMGLNVAGTLTASRIVGTSATLAAILIPTGGIFLSTLA